MKTKIEITSYLGPLLFTYEGVSLKEAVVAAVKSGANLSRANLSGAYLSGAQNMPAIAAAQSSIVPESGPFFAWKKCRDGVLVHLAIDSKAKRSNAAGRMKLRVMKSREVSTTSARALPSTTPTRAVGAASKPGISRQCRAELVKVLEVIGAEVGISLHDGKTEYRVGQIVRCDKWNDDRWIECGGGIHFYLTRAEAEAHC